MSFSDLGLLAISIPGFSVPKFSTSKEITPASDDDLNGKDIFYKWYDSEGNIQFSSEPPADGIEYTLKGFDPDTNVIQAVKLPPERSKTDDSTPEHTKTAAPKDDVNPYSGDSIKKLFEDTRNIEKLLGQRLQDRESALNQ